ncbi:MAG: tetratricopeptide repeat protein [Parachlamydiales bacterium]|nr:tetratricopeptide repeat protein [Parachlamydiales bacterium]
MIRYILMIFVPCFFVLAAPTNVTVENAFERVVQTYQEKKWNELLTTSKRIVQEYAHTSFADEALFYQGVAYFHLKNYERANHFFSRFLKSKSAANHFEESLSYKYHIAEAYKVGVRKHLFGVSSFPKWVGGKEDAIQIFDELIRALPQDDLAAKALFSKGEILLTTGEYDESLEVYQELLRRFPSHDLAVESYLNIGRIYLEKIDSKQQDESLLHLAQLNYERFATAFPHEKRLEDAKKMIFDMQQKYADGLYEIGRFYERTKKKSAAGLYYERVVQQFPETKAARLSQMRLKKIGLSNKQ